VFFHFDLKGHLMLARHVLCVGSLCDRLAPLAWLIMSEIFPTIRRRPMALPSFPLDGSICSGPKHFILSQVCRSGPHFLRTLYLLCVCFCCHSAGSWFRNKGQVLEDRRSWAKAPEAYCPEGL
jgi:hypothetical protein